MTLEDELDEKRLPFTEHLRELRTRTIRAVAYVFVAVLVAWGFHEQLFLWLKEPYDTAVLAAGANDHARLAFRGVTEPFVVYLKVSGIIGGLAAMPLVLLELWLFIAPGLYRKERRLAIPFLVASVLFFFGGVAFCRYLVLEPAIQFLLSTGGEGTEASVMMAEYLDFTGRVMFVFGIMFELPVATSFGAMLGLITHHALIRHWKYAIVAAFVAAAAFTPPDVSTQILLAVPLCVLYGVSILLAWLITTGRGAPDDAPADPPVSAPDEPKIG